MDGGDAECDPMIAVLLLATACSVLTKADIASVQGEPYTEAKLTTRKDSTTCFYQLPTFVNSVSVDLMKSGAREFFEKRLEEGEHEEGERKREPLEIEGVGSEALWVMNPIAGSLYVRKGDKLLRVSVGGPGSEKEKIARSKKLAKKALKRM